MTSADGTPIYVSQVAQVVVGHRPRQGKVGRGTEDDVVEGIVLMRKYEKSLPTATAVQVKIEEINGSGLMPKGMRIVPFNRRTDLVHVTTHNVLHNLLVGVGLVVVVLLVFLGDLASAAIVALVIPLALLFAVTVLYLRGQSANLLSLGAVDFGIIVDSSVIIVETIFRHVTGHQGHDLTEEHKLPWLQRIAGAAHGVERPMFYSTMIIVCAFLPLFTLSGPAGALFGPMAATYAYSILGALLVSVTLAPVLCSLLFKNKKEEKQTPLDRLMTWVYGKALRAVLRNRGGILGDDGGVDGVHDQPDSEAGRGVHAAVGGGESVDSGNFAADGEPGGGVSDGATDSRHHREGPGSARGDVARGSAGRWHGRDEFFQS